MFFACFFFRNKMSATVLCNVWIQLNGNDTLQNVLTDTPYRFGSYGPKWLSQLGSQVRSDQGQYRNDQRPNWVYSSVSRRKRQGSKWPRIELVEHHRWWLVVVGYCWWNQRGQRRSVMQPNVELSRVFENEARKSKEKQSSRGKLSVLISWTYAVTDGWVYYAKHVLIAGSFKATSIIERQN